MREMKLIIKKVITILLTATVVLAACGCNAGKYSYIDEDKLLIVTTLFPQYDFARQIAGDKAEVVLLLSPGMEAHDFEPTPSDIILINKADLFIYTGDEMEPWVATILESIDNPELNVLDVSEGIEVICEEENHDHNHVYGDEDDHAEKDGHNEEDESDSHEGEDEHDEEDHQDENIIFGEDGQGHDHDHDHSHSADPHIWTSPVNAMKMVEAVEQAIIELDGSNEEQYKENAHNYIHQLEDIDRQFRDIVASADSHTIYFGGRFAMSYFAEEYDLNYAAAFDSCQAESEPSARLIVKIIEKMREDGAKYIFYEEMTDPKAARIIAEEIGGEILLLHSCHNVSKTEMENGVTYVSLMKQNVEHIRRALSEI